MSVDGDDGRAAALRRCPACPVPDTRCRSDAYSVMMVYSVYRDMYMMMMMAAMMEDSRKRKRSRVPKWTMARCVAPVAVAPSLKLMFAL